MKKILSSILAVFALMSCSKQVAEPTRHVNWSYDATIYEINVRQFTPEGTFAAAEAQLPTLKQLGVDILWIMPCQEIGVVGRKGTLGSYYAIKDYCKPNPEFGTLEDFCSLVNKAHELGMHVILDWVANHTAPDSEWTNNEGWHYRDSLGQLVVQYDWTDIAKLDYHSDAMRAEMLRCMRFWLENTGIDGFRCDVAGEIPTDFWNWAYADIKTDYPNLFKLAENEDKAQELTEEAFDMYYGWELHSHMNKVAQGEETVEDLWAYFQKCDTTIRPEAIRMNFTSNHDENSWAGTEFERMGDATDAFAAFTYLVPGMPLIYTGQEYALDHRLEFFEKDSFERKDVPQFAMYQKLNAFRKSNKALQCPELGAPMVRLATDNAAIFACARPAEGNTVLGIINFSGEEQTVTLQAADYAGHYTCLCGQEKDIEATTTLTLQPNQYMLLSK